MIYVGCVQAQALHGSLNLVDLAGSERLDRSGATGDRLKETQVRVCVCVCITYVYIYMCIYILCKEVPEPYPLTWSGERRAPQFPSCIRLI